ncbi:Hypothetical protein MexAM1_META2p0704 (plasmid) [Methylorubrum extorquens AM1]|uniref:Secreted protein n=2 Tax=Methylorubrum extorquens TaxID=408 RepID=C5B516_METEA|nr:Hypothetical protein MexAM1_META2p0704 [Methylorubrum extorquens AM1]
MSRRRNVLIHALAIGSLMTTTAAIALDNSADTDPLCNTPRGIGERLHKERMQAQQASAPSNPTTPAADNAVRESGPPTAPQAVRQSEPPTIPQAVSTSLGSAYAPVSNGNMHGTSNGASAVVRGSALASVSREEVCRRFGRSDTILKSCLKMIAR